MSTLILDKVLSGYNLAKVNDNFERIEKAFNEALVHRDGSKELTGDLDINSQKLLNVGGIEIGGVDIATSISQLQEEWQTLFQGIEEYKTAADEILAEAISYGAVDQKSIGNAQRVFTTTQSYAANANLTLPLPYVVGKNTLHLNMNHYYDMFKGVDYEEVGTINTQSTTIKLLKPVSSGVQIEELVDGDNDLYSIYTTAEALQTLLTTSYSPESISAFVDAVSDIEELDLEDKIEQLNTQYEQLVDYSTALQTTVADINTKYSTITDMYEDMGTKYSLLETLYPQLLALLSDTDFDLDDLNSAIGDINDAIEDINDAMEDIQGYAESASDDATAAASSASDAADSALEAASYVSTINTSVNNARIWAEGTDEEVSSLSGTHSAKEWAEQAEAAQQSAVKFTSQSLTSSQKTQARTNIAAQKELTTTQMSAVNSGITSTKVSTYDGYASTIAAKLDKTGGTVTGALTLSAGEKGINVSGETVDIATLFINSAGSIQTYYSNTDSGVANITGLPVSGRGFILRSETVRYASSTDYHVVQYISQFKKSYVRNIYCNSGTTSISQWKAISEDGSVFNVRDFGAVGDGVTDDTAAIQAAFDAAHAAGGGTVFFPAGKYKRPDSSARLFIYSNTNVVGVGDASIIYHYDTDTNASNILLSSTQTVSNITFKDIKFLGTLDQFTSETNGSPNISIEPCKNIRFENVTFELLRKSAIGLYRCEGVSVINCRFLDIQRDGVRCDKGRNIQVIGNQFTRVADDPVAIHYEKEGTTGNIKTQSSIISGNVFDACQGIQLLGAKNTVISDNIFNRSMKRCVFIRNVPDNQDPQPTSELTGYVPQYNIQIVNNIMLDTFGCFNNVDEVIRIENGVPTSAYGNTSPQESLNVAGQGETSVPLDGLIIDGNVIGWTLPVGVDYSSYGYGQLLQRNGQGWFDLSCTDSTFACKGIYLEGAMKNVRITNNKFSGQKFRAIDPEDATDYGLPAIVFRSDQNSPAKIMLENVAITGNSFYDWSAPRCISMGYGGSGCAVNGLDIENNSFNLDPYFRNSGHASDNTWSGQYACVGLYVSAGTYCVGRAFRNTFKNCSYPVSSNSLVIDDNDVYFEPSGDGVGGQSGNKGVRYIDAYRNYNCHVIDGDPTSSTFMRVVSVPLKMSASMPSSGTYVKGHFIKNAGVSTIVDGNVTKFVIGWKRLTTGNTHVLGTDWLEVTSLTPDSVNSALDSKLSTGGGVMTGAITRSGNFVVAPDVASQVTLCGGKSTVNGARLDLYGESHSSHSTEFILTCRSSALGYSAALQGKPDGSLLWNGQAVQTSSDERLKTPLDDVPDEVLDAWEDVDWGQFQFLSAVEAKGESARQHLGLIAQRVKTVFETHGLDACAYGILCHEEHPEHDWEEEDADGNIIKHHEDAVDLWMIRYEEALAMEAAYQRRRVDHIESRLKAIEERLG